MKKTIKLILNFLCKHSLCFQKLRLLRNYNYYYKKQKQTLPLDKIHSECGIVYVLAPSYSNLGDVAIFVKSLDFLKKYAALPIKAVLYSRQCVNKKKLRSLPLNDDDLIIIQGGGNMGAVYSSEEYLRQNIVKWFPKNRIISMPQTVFFGDKKKNYILSRAKKIYSSHKSLTIFARDVPSLDFCKQNFKCDVRICPDMVLSALPKRFFDYQKNKKVLLCFRKDIESKMENAFVKNIENCLNENGFSFEYWDTDDLSGRNINNKEEKVQQVLEYFNHFQFVVTDRYHGTILSYISKTPCIGLDNSYGKVKNGFLWFKNCNYMFYADSLEKVKKAIGEIQNLENLAINNQLISEFHILKESLNA